MPLPVPLRQGVPHPGAQVASTRPSGEKDMASTVSRAPCSTGGWRVGPRVLQSAILPMSSPRAISRLSGANARAGNALSPARETS
ncbi:hypothetical protein [Microbispora sp. KK1-11]|uniref:hypothetical protein n=1 Tax=Microbispora sp. KK1-11 TaxID=2053005 RepID=UPI001159FF46|nr:hypothetical protein [Microbispora sp. KK1-11]TQS19109.1 hypothetical protein FLW16_42020 [Microbispora sp. KK1-11]